MKNDRARRRFPLSIPHFPFRTGGITLQFTYNSVIIFGLEVHWYGILIACGMALAVLLAALRERRLGLPKDTALDLALLGIPAAIVCARLYYVIFSWEAYAATPIRALYIWEGGMAIYGGIIGGVLAGFFYARRKKLPFLKLADLAAPSIALGQAVGRWGNFINQEAYGAAVAHAWQRRFPVGVFIEADGLWHYATFFYESAWCLLIVIALLLAERKGRLRRDGDIFLSYVFLYALERALVEGLRTDSLYLGPLRISQLLSLAAMIVCAALLIRRSERKLPGVAALACAVALAALLLTGHPVVALIPAAGALACFAAGLFGAGQPVRRG